MQAQSDKLDYRKLLSGEIPPWVMRFLKTTGKAVSEYGMFGDGDDVLIAVSGGKDSLALALALSLRQRWLPIHYRLHALLIDWREHPVGEEHKALLRSYFEDLGIDLTIVPEVQRHEGFKGEFNCYLCSRNRRRIFFQFLESHGWHLVAEGHHLDDLVETTMMNLFFRGRFETMSPVQGFFGGKIKVIRPMIEVHEKVTRRLAETYNIPCIKAVCPFDQTNIRSSLKPILGQLTHMDRLVREHVYAAHGLPR
ncbi:MAG: tRNA 2-thiocytidine biosynthesis TtcA family protein [Sphaerochaetaceae bacterium]|nr:tRNA 2-thiocytidine biosynthesis TtcA family protein [Spirochaetales bacterium]MDY5499868.1 tRNA 2-thiocytidine biosynthesis TtcA family protein [Sphaerochaetaceae bacterium]